MRIVKSAKLSHLRHDLTTVLTGPPVLAFLPAITLGAFWFGGEPALVVTSLGLPLVFALTGAFGRPAPGDGMLRDMATGLLMRDGFEIVLDRDFRAAQSNGLRSACFLIELDGFDDLIKSHGRSAADLVARRMGERILSALRDGDTVARLSDSQYAICLRPTRQMDLELCIQLAGRLQATVEDPVSLDGLSVYVSGSIGFCQHSVCPGEDSAAWLDAAATALNEAVVHGPSSIRAFSPDLQHKARARSELHEEIETALESGQIQPWYQPQISTDTGDITGFEALARWAHPTRGLIAPDRFLPALEEAGLMERLGQVMLYHALTALKAWDSAGAEVPRVGVNFATQELLNPRLAERIQWELDRFELTPDRLSIEVLETVVSDTPDDIITRNIAELGRIGCRIDLDDFGTGHASIAAIRRFAISRIKIDRSFVMKADRDPEQQRMITAILTMAERLDLETLAEGVETVGEHAVLAQLGCGHVQGFGIGRPMPFDQTLDWAAAHRAKLQETPRISGKNG
ncbi:putative bifunctional diguanylate cyclase/phosphodiesterase [Primorskyibacter sp. S87]|uniref:putative bifunctional diguanylate cyclase/phosphodiesterase n=1 Tax=Primorskyibacter sp. S87 TaxID=3415126 RepID=UPI003C7D8A06